MLVYGSSIGEGNYQPIPNEVIWLQSNISSKLVTGVGLSDTGSTTLNLESDSNGAIGKGIKGVSVSSMVRDTASAGTRVYFSLYGLAMYSHWNEPYGKVNNTYTMLSSFISTNISGDLTYSVEASGAGTFYIDLLVYNAIQT
jgi:hypothetical protein